MPPFDDKQGFKVNDREDEPAPIRSPWEPSGDDTEEIEDDDPEALETDESEEELSPDELADEMKEFTVAEWKEAFPDCDVEDLEEKIPDTPSRRWMPWIASCLMGSALGGAFAGLLVSRWPQSEQASRFFFLFPVLALLLSCAWYWLFYLNPERIAKKMKNQETNLADSEPIQPTGSEPIHPK